LLVTDISGFNQGYFTLRSGDGGGGTKTGGAGGSVSSIRFLGYDVSLSATTGNGGNASSGKGGSGGGFNNNSFSDLGDVNGSGSFSTIATGNGGDSTVGNGGAGGSISSTNSVAEGDVSVTTGAGGNGDTLKGHAGSGGSIKNSSGDAIFGSNIFSTGNAGTNGAKGGNGGSIIGSNVLGAGNLTILTGHGSNGGAGGNINTIGYSGGGNTSAPLGAVTIVAGDGSVSSSAAGAGGSILNVTGYIGQTGATIISAGSVFGTSTVGAAGGSINGLTILGGGGGTSLVVTAGDASDATSAKTGAKGGSVSGLTIIGSNGTSAGVDPATIIRSIAAGDGGNGAKTGGAGGSATKISVSNLDIGVRQGVDYGYGTMGGIFVGVGGTGASANGVNGSVIQVNADSIAAIVAGKADMPQLVNVVDKIYLNGHTAPTFSTASDPVTGAYTNLDTANIVGGVADPNRANAFEFQYLDSSLTLQTNSSATPYDPTVDRPVDGLIAAKTFTANRNFTPGALLTTDASGNLLPLIDSTTV
jgi:hypothetical protein